MWSARERTAPHPSRFGPRHCGHSCAPATGASSVTPASMAIHADRAHFLVMTLLPGVSAAISHSFSAPLRSASSGLRSDPPASSQRLSERPGSWQTARGSSFSLSESMAAYCDQGHALHTAAGQHEIADGSDTVRLGVGPTGRWPLLNLAGRWVGTEGAAGIVRTRTHENLIEIREPWSRSSRPEQTSAAIV